MTAPHLEDSTILRQVKSVEHPVEPAVGICTKSLVEVRTRTKVLRITLLLLDKGVMAAAMRHCEYL